MKNKSLKPGQLILGLLVAATGVGAGDLITASLAGSEVGLVVLWAVVVGAGFKWALNEGISRWQLATESTLVEGWVSHLHFIFSLYFALYFICWSYAVGGALVNACGVAGVGLVPLGEPHTAKIIWGIMHSLAGLIIVWFGGFRLFQYVMSGFIVVMVGSVLLTAVLVAPSTREIFHGLLQPGIPQGGVEWLLGVLGGVGGTVTLLSYGYWIREKNRHGRSGLRLCQFDLGVGYFLTSLFGLAMVIIGSRIKVQGRGATVALQLADQLALSFGEAGKWIFLLGFWAAVFTSLLGVWQSVPYIFSDFFKFIWENKKKSRFTPEMSRQTYRGYLVALSLIPLSLLWLKVQIVQLFYAVLGALFMPFLALTLLLLNNKKELVGRTFRNNFLINVLLILSLLVFIWIGLEGL